MLQYFLQYAFRQYIRDLIDHLYQVVTKRETQENIQQTATSRSEQTSQFLEAVQLVAWLADPSTMLRILKCAWPEVLDMKHAEVKTVWNTRMENDLSPTDAIDVWERVIQIELERPILRKPTSYVVGFVDAVATVGWGVDGDVVAQASFYIEAKPEIKSLEDFLQQINVYRSCVHDGHWVVVCQNDRHRDLLEQQNIALVTPSDLETA